MPKIRAQNTSIPSVYYKFIIVYMYIIPFDIHHAYIYTCILCKYIYICLYMQFIWCFFGGYVSFLPFRFFSIISGSQLTCFSAFRCLSFVSHIVHKAKDASYNT